MEDNIAAGVGATKLSELTIDADLAMGAHDITIGAGQTVDGKDVSGLGVGDMLKSVFDSDDDGIFEGTVIQLLKQYLIGDATLHSHDAELHNWETSYTKRKTITIDSLYPDPSTIRISFDMRISFNPDVAYGKIYKNGVAAGIERVNDTTSYVTYTQDISFAEGDTLELWAYTTIGNNSVIVKNFRIKGTTPPNTLTKAITDSTVGDADGLAATNS